jgi:hypothetical protein
MPKIVQPSSNKYQVLVIHSPLPRPIYIPTLVMGMIYIPTLVMGMTNQRPMSKKNRNDDAGDPS